MNRINRSETDLSIVVPSYNARTRAHATVRALCDYFAGVPLKVEIVLVDDGSREAERPDGGLLPEGVRFIQLDRNRGKGFAVRSGLDAATGRMRVFTDVDLAYGIDAILQCYEKLSSTNADIVHGDRSLPDSKRTAHVRKRRRVSSTLFNAAVFGITGLRQRDTQCGIKGLKGSTASSILPLLTIDGFAFDVELFRCAADNGLTLEGMSVHLENTDVSTVRLARHSTRMLRDLVHIRLRSLRGGYRIFPPR